MSLPDILAPGLRVVFCGSNPSLRAVALGHHFAGGSNRFWRVLHEAGFTAKRLSPELEQGLLTEGLGLASVVGRPTARAGEVTPGEYRAGGWDLERRLCGCAPAYVAFLGKTAFAAIRGRRSVVWGRQPEPFAGAVAWVLPDPSGRNGAFPLSALIEAYRALRVAGEAAPPTSCP